MVEVFQSVRIPQEEAQVLLPTPEEQLFPRDPQVELSPVTLNLGRLGILAGYREDIAPLNYGAGHALSGTLMTAEGDVQYVHAKFHRSTFMARALGRGIQVSIEKIAPPTIVKNHS